MKLEEGVYPNFYKDYPQIIEEKAQMFVGRERWLQLQWEDLYQIANGGVAENLAYLAHRKSGKTAFLRKFYNVTFNEQREVIPFYYEFSNNKVNGKEAARDVLESLICQATDFLLEKSYYIEKGKFEECLQKLHQLKSQHEWANNILQRHDEYCKKEERIPDDRCNELLFYAWSFVHKIDGKPCVLIVDEAQEMARSLFGIDNEGKKTIVPCQLSLSSVYHFQSVWVVLSGSRVSELYYKMVGALANRISRQDFPLLDEKDARQFMRNLVQKYNYDICERLYDDVWEITQGHPFYIETIFKPNEKDYQFAKNKTKSFKNLQELQEVLYFEVTHPKGKLRRFWENHFVENVEYLDEDIKEHKITLQILYYIASNDRNTIRYSQIKEKFNVENVHKKIQQLMDADLVQVQSRSQIVDKLNDNLLSLFLANKFSEEIFGERTEKEIRNELDKLLREILGNRLDEIYKEFTLKFNTYDEQMNKMRGKLSFHLGMIRQNEIIKRVQATIEQKEGIFSNVRLLDKLKSVNVYEDSGMEKKIGEIDGCAPIEMNGEKIALIIEVKDWKKSVGTPQVNAFVKGIHIIQQELECKKAMCVYISESGFSKPAEKILEKNNIVWGRANELLNDQIVAIIKPETTPQKKTETTQATKESRKKTKANKTKIKKTEVKTKTKTQAKKKNTANKMKTKSA